jgi:hypothetical protein
MHFLDPLASRELQRIVCQTKMKLYHPYTVRYDVVVVVVVVYMMCVSLVK